MEIETENKKVEVKKILTERKNKKAADGGWNSPYFSQRVTINRCSKAPYFDKGNNRPRPSANRNQPIKIANFVVVVICYAYYKLFVLI